MARRASGEQVKLDKPASNDVTKIDRDVPLGTDTVYVKQASVVLESSRGSQAGGSVLQIQSPL